MIRCHHCGNENLAGSEYCDECGTRLQVAASHPSPGLTSTPARAGLTPPSPVTQVTPPAPTFTRETITPKPATPYTPPPPPVQAAPPAVPKPGAVAPLPPPPPVTAIKNPSGGHPPVESPAATRSPEARKEDAAGGRFFSGDLRGESNGLHTAVVSRQNGGQTEPIRKPDTGEERAMNSEMNGVQVRAKLVIQRGGRVGREFPLSSAEAMIGRWDADGGIFPDVDLDQDDPEAKVSRRHARIQCNNNQYLIEDLGSTNGTFINRGPRLLPGNKQPLSNGDEIIVGKTFLKFVLS